MSKIMVLKGKSKNVFTYLTVLAQYKGNKTLKDLANAASSKK